ncbi:MAG: hypothetical protein ACLUHE_16085 [Christensenellales bacterium]
MLGCVKSDPQTGALTLRFDNLPEIKLGDFDLEQNRAAGRFRS